MNGKSRTGKKFRRGPAKADRDTLHRAALVYLGRYASSVENLRRVLLRRVERSARAYGTERAHGAAMVDEIIDRLQRAGLLDDTAYAEGKAASLHRRGASCRLIRARLAAKGVADGDIERALASLEPDGDADRAAAVAYARRRKIGPWRHTARAEYRERDLAALARQGFDYETARWIVAAESPEALEAAIAEPRDPGRGGIKASGG